MQRGMVLSLCFALSAPSAYSQHFGTGRSLAGWYDLFPPYQKHFYPMYAHPVVGKMKGEDKTYSQTVRFDEATGLVRAFSATVARDPNFKERFSHEAMKDAPATTSEIGKRTAWVWNDNKKVVVLVGDDKVVLLEVDPNSEGMALVDYAKSLDYDRIEKALAKPPRIDFSLTVETFSVFKKGENVFTLQDWAGIAKSHEQVGKKVDDRIRWVYALKDGTDIVVTTVAWRIEAITHKAADGKLVELLK